MTSADPIAAYLASKNQPGSAAPSPTIPNAPNVQSDDPIGAYQASKKRTDTGVPDPAQSAVKTSDPIGSYFQSKFGSNAAPSLSSRIDNPSAANQGPVLAEDRLGTDLPWWNRPIQTYLGFGQYREGAGPIEKGVEKFTSGMLTPLNIGLMVATGGLGSLAEGAGMAAVESGLGAESIAALKAAGWTTDAIDGAATTLVRQGWSKNVATEALKGLADPSLAQSTAQNLVRSLAPESARTVMLATRTAAQMAHAKFTYDQIAGLAHGVPAVADAIKTGDTDKAIELGTEALLSGFMGVLTGRHLRDSIINHGVVGYHPLDIDPLTGRPTLTPTQQMTGEHQFGIEKGARTARDFGKNTPFENLAGTPVDKAVRFYREAGGDVDILRERLRDWEEADWLRQDIKEKHLQPMRDAIAIADDSPEGLALENELKARYGVHWREKIDAGLVKETPSGGPVPEGFTRVYGDPAKGEWFTDVQQAKKSAGVKYKAKLHFQDIADDQLDGFPKVTKTDAISLPEELNANAKIVGKNTGAENYAGQRVYEPNAEDETDFVTRGELNTKKPSHMQRRGFDSAFDAMMAKDEEGNSLNLDLKNEGAIAAYKDYVRKHYAALGVKAAQDKGQALVDAADARKIVVDYKDKRKVFDKKLYVERPDLTAKVPEAVQSTGQPETVEGTANPELLAGAPSGNPEGDLDSPSFSAAKTAEGKLQIGADVNRLTEVLGASLYRHRGGGVVGKELIQNAVDAAKTNPDGKGIVRVGSKADKFFVEDNGPGMTRDELFTVFSDLGSSGKVDQEGASGGFGLAKAAPFLIADKIHVKTVAEMDGKKYESSFTSTPSQARSGDVDVETHEVSRAHPTGTRVLAYMPDSYSAIDFATGLEHSADLPVTIKKTYNVPEESDPVGGGVEKNWLGKETPNSLENQTKYDTGINKSDRSLIHEGDVPGAHLKIYETKERFKPFGTVSLAISNNGMYQFDSAIWLPHGADIPEVPGKIIVDVRPTVKEGDTQYPFTTSREALRDDSSVGQFVKQFVEDKIIKPAVERQTALAKQVYEGLPKMGGRVAYDAGSRLTDKEVSELNASPAFKDVVDSIGSVGDIFLDRLKKSDVGFGHGTERVGTVLSDAVHGLYIRHPSDRTLGTLLINPFTAKNIDNQHPSVIASRVVSTIVHEIAHEKVGGHTEQFAQVMGEVAEAVGEDYAAALQKVEKAYADPARPGKVRPDLDRIIQLYKESRGRPESAPDLLGGEKLSTNRSDDAAPDQSGHDAVVPTGGEERVRNEPSPEHREYAEAVDKAEAEYAARGTAAVKAYQDAGKTPEALKALRAEKQAALETKTAAVAEAAEKLRVTRLWPKRLGGGRTETADVASYRTETLDTPDESPVDQTTEGPRPEQEEAPPIRFKDENGFIHEDGKVWQPIHDYVEGPRAFNENKIEMRTPVGQEDAVPIAERTPALIHPKHAADVMRSFEDHSLIRDNVVGRAALWASGKAKQSLLSLSPFHAQTIFLRGVQKGFKPGEIWNPPEIDSPNAPIRDNPSVGGVKTGLVLSGAGEYSKAAEGSAESLPAYQKVPGIGPALKAFNDASNRMFETWIPRLKAMTWKKTVAGLREQHPDWSDQQVWKTASDESNATFGGINWRQLGISKTWQDSLRLLMLAPDFTGSHILLGKTALEGGGSVVSQGLMRIAAYNMLAAQATNLLVSHKLHLDHPFGVVSPDEKKVYSVRTMPADIFHLMWDPRGFAANRMNPLTVRSAVEFATGKNDQGKLVDGQQQMLDLFRNVIPMSAQNFVGMAVPGITRGQKPSLTEAIARVPGLSISNDATRAERLAGQFASSHAQDGPVDPDRLAKHQAAIQFEEELAAKTKTTEDLNKAVEAGQFAPADAKAIITAVKTAANVPPQFMQLYLRANKLPMKNLLAVWDSATPTEQRVLAPILQKKVPAYFRTVQTKMTPAEIQNDPVFTQLRARWPGVPIF